MAGDTQLKDAQTAPAPLKAGVAPAVNALPLKTEAVAIDEHCVGDRWTVQDIDHLARIIAIIAMGQAAHAAEILKSLLPSAPAINLAALRTDATRRLTISGSTQEQLNAARWRRDGLLFEAISWIAARQTAADRTYLKDPHLSSTTQGLDGLMIELDEQGKALHRATIFEDKCSDNPRQVFQSQVMKAFLEHHRDGRASDLVAAASTLIEKSGLNGTEATIAAARVLDKQFRIYRGSLAVSAVHDSQSERKKLFKDYGDLDGITADQRVGATFVTPAELRPWFDSLADQAIAYIKTLGTGGA